MMRFFLFRHADKERSFSANPPLSRQGLEQAEALRQLLENKELPAPNQLLSSPKIRALQTFEPLAMHLGLKVQSNPELLERQGEESSTQFLARVRGALARYEKQFEQKSAIFVVTHYDWIEAFLVSANCDTDFSDSQFHSWAPAQYMEFEVNEGRWHFCRTGRVQS